MRTKTIGIALLIFMASNAQANPRVWLEEMTSIEVKQAIHNGSTTVLIPTGGTEQNGPHMVLGKHNFIIRYTCIRIAEVLGQTLVAPVVSYVPEGDIRHNTGHMAYAGTISISNKTFENLLKESAESLIQHGFKVICFVGDSGDNQVGQARVAKTLNSKYHKKGIRVIHVSEYYSANGQVEYLQQGLSEAVIGTHASVRDTSELLVVYPNGVRTQNIPQASLETGVRGDPAKASVEIGTKMLDLKIKAAVAQITREVS